MMKVLIRQRKTGLYLGPDGNWGPEGQAWELKSLSAAGEEAWSRQGAEMVVIFEDEGRATRLDLEWVEPNRRRAA